MRCPSLHLGHPLMSERKAIQEFVGLAHGRKYHITDEATRQTPEPKTMCGINLHTNWRIIMNGKRPHYRQQCRSCVRKSK